VVSGQWAVGINDYVFCLLTAHYQKGGAGGVEPLTSAVTEPRAIPYTTCRIEEQWAVGSGQWVVGGEESLGCRVPLTANCQLCQ
jgi:hypothetical protein